VGIDIEPQSNYPFEFLQADALALDDTFLRSFDVIHASPPCQSYSDLAKRNRNAHEWPRLIEPVRELLISSGRTYVIENVQGAPLLDPLVLCGTMFPELRVIRHRLFESNVQLTAPDHGRHPLVFTHDKRKSHYGKLDQNTMGIDWMTKAELNESIPPSYTRHIGKQLIRLLAASDGSLEGLLRSA
jgi:DNA (cytosine-5)-methyltransferase 1